MPHIVIQGQHPMHIEVQDGSDPAEAVAIVAKALYGDAEKPLAYVDCGPDRYMAVALAQLPPYVAPSSPEGLAAIKQHRVAAIKAEAARRILDRYPMWKQMNLRQSGGDACLAMDAWINSVRARSNELEVLVPADFAEDDHWPK